MNPLLFASLFVLTLSLGLFTPQVGMTEETKHDDSKLKHLGLKDGNGKHIRLNEGNGSTTHRSVPIPGTELLLGGALAGIVYWRERRKRG